MVKELLLGILIATVGFLHFLGYDVVPLVMLGTIGLVAFFLLRNNGVVKNRSVGVNISRHSVEFGDIGGQGPAKQEIREALEFIVQLDKFREMGIRPLKGILLTGPPGTGKTLLAKASATYTDAIFVAASGSEFIEMYAGVGAQRVRSLFESARQRAKKMKKRAAVIFIDEIEVIGGKRGSHSSHLEYDQTLNQLLVEMDGIKTNEEVQVLIMGATNRADLIDQALLRPGRFDRIINVDLPDVDSRRQILKIHTSNKPLEENVDLEKIARDTFGFSGAQLENVCNEAAIYALREGAAKIGEQHLKEAVDKVMMGEKAEKKPTSEEKERIAYHESGHALMSELVRKNSVSYVTITSRGNALGYIRQRPASDMYLYTKEYMLDQINICLAGAVAEELFLGSKSSGSMNDFKQAINLARQLINCGLSDLGIVDSELVSSQMMHKEVKKVIQVQENHTRDLLEQHGEVIGKMVEVLRQRENITSEQLQEMLYDGQGTLVC